MRFSKKHNEHVKSVSTELPLPEKTRLDGYVAARNTTIRQLLSDLLQPIVNPPMKLKEPAKHQ